MSKRSGYADLPLHGGHVPSWLSERMTLLGRLITEAVIHHYGREEFLRRLAHPFWFQCFGAVMGMDWHSSGMTTSVMAALKKGLRPIQDEIGIYVCGGKGQYSRNTPFELIQVGERTGLDGNKLASTSKLIAKVDSAAVQDGFNLYLHDFIVTKEGTWTVVQQGMNAQTRMARRYHWLSENLKSFIDEPHSAIDGPNQGTIINLTAHAADKARKASVELVQLGPEKIQKLFQEALPHLQMPLHHEVKASNILNRRLQASLRAAHERGPQDFQELLQTPNLGPRTLFALALVAEVVHGTPFRFTDPARFSLAHGGKDRHPYPVPLKIYDKTIQVFKEAVQSAKIGNSEKLAAIRRLDKHARQFDNLKLDFDTEAFMHQEMRKSASYGGMSVFGPEKQILQLVEDDKSEVQLPLFQTK